MAVVISILVLILLALWWGKIEQGKRQRARKDAGGRHYAPKPKGESPWNEFGLTPKQWWASSHPLPPSFPRPRLLTVESLAGTSSLPLVRRSSRRVPWRLLPGCRRRLARSLRRLSSSLRRLQASAGEHLAMCLLLATPFIVPFYVWAYTS